MNYKTKEKINISPESKIKVYWDDFSHNYSKEAKTKVRNHFATKYGVSRTNVNVIYRPVKLNDSGDLIEMSGLGIENIMDVSYQRRLIKEIIVRDGKETYFDRVIELDNKINAILNVDLTCSQHRSWSIKWLTIDNFLSFGEKNYLSFNNLKGITIVNSLPTNFGGKTTLTIDACKFLLHGTTTKTNTNEQIFNIYTDKNEVNVRGMIEIENEETIIERKLVRKLKKDGEWGISNKVNFYKVLSDGTEELLNDEDAIKTTKKIKESIGSEKDFELLVLATANNLDDLIGLTSGESGKILTRLIGLEILELKEASVRLMYNKFISNKKSNQYDITTLNSDIVAHKKKVIECSELEITLKNKLEETKLKLITLNSENDVLLGSKNKIDATISSMNPSKLQEEIDEITEIGKKLKTKHDELIIKINLIGEIKFDEDEHLRLTKLINGYKTSKAVKESEVKTINKLINELISGGICKSCNRKLDNIDNTEHINKHKIEATKITDDINRIDSDIVETEKSLTILNTTKTKLDEKNTLELSRDRQSVDLELHRGNLKEKRADLNKYNTNLISIEANKQIDIKITKIKTDIAVLEHTKEETIKNIEKNSGELKINTDNIVTKDKIIEIILKEEEEEKIYKIYIDLIGKKGISKLVLRSVLPIINSEVQRLLEDVCGFEIEIFMDEKNDVQFLINEGGINRLLKSGSGFEKTVASLALRSVLGKVSTLPMPNFITFDEVLGKVSMENLDSLKALFDKIKEMYDIVFFITHNDMVKNWGDNTITVIKENKISRINSN